MDPASEGYGYSQAFTQHSSSGLPSVSSSLVPPTISYNCFSPTQPSLTNFELFNNNLTHDMQSQCSDYPPVVQCTPHIESHHTRSAGKSTTRVTEFSVPLHRIHEVDMQAPDLGFMEDMPRPAFPVVNAQEHQHALISNLQPIAPFEAFQIQAGPAHVHAPTPHRRIDIVPIERGARTYPGLTRSESMAHNSRADYAASLTQGQWPMATRLAGHGQAFEDVAMQQAQSQDFMDWITTINEPRTANLGIDMQGLSAHIRRHSEPVKIRQTSSSFRREVRSVHGIHSPKAQQGLGDAIPNSKGSGTDPTDYFTMLANWDKRPDTMVSPQSADRNGCGTTAGTGTPHGVTASGIGTANLAATSGLDPIAAFELYNTLVPRNQPTTSDLSRDTTTLPFLGPFGIPSYSPLRPDQLARPVLEWYCKTGAIHLCSCEKRFRHCRDLYRHVAESGGNHSIVMSTPHAIWVCPLCVRFRRVEVRILLDHMEEEHGVDFTDELRDTDDDRAATRTSDSYEVEIPVDRPSQEATSSSIAPTDPPKPKRRKKKTAEEKAQEMAALPDRNIISAENLFYQYFTQVYMLWNPAEKADDERRGDKRTMSVWSVVKSTPQSLRQWNRAATKFAGMGNASDVIARMIGGGSLPCPSSVKRFNRDTKWDSLPQFITFGPAIFV